MEQVTDRKMYEYFSQTSVRLPHSGALLERLDIPSGMLGCSTTHSGLETTLAFDGGQAIIRSSDKNLLLWVAAENIVILFGIRTVLEVNILEASIHEVSRAQLPAIRWYSAGATPFA